MGKAFAEAVLQMQKPTPTKLDSTITLPDPVVMKDRHVACSVLVLETQDSHSSQRIPPGFRQAMRQFRLGLDALEHGHCEVAIAASTTSIDLVSRIQSALPLSTQSQGQLLE